MDKHRSRFDGMSTGQYLSLLINHHNVVSLSLAPQQTSGIEEKASAFIRDFNAEVIADAFGQPMMRCGPQSKS
jgi:hypothetical protein